MKLAISTIMLLTLGACDTSGIAVNSTSKVIYKGRFSMKMESDFDHAARAIPGSLKTLETFHVAHPKNELIRSLLAEGYCQYATAFVDDEWEIAQFIEKDYDKADYIAGRVTKHYIRCMNYGLSILGKKFEKTLFNGTQEEIAKAISKVGKSKRTALLWTAVGLAGSINKNKDNMTLISYVSTVKEMMFRVLEIDAKSPPKDPTQVALPHMIMGMLYAAQSPAMGGKPDLALKHFKMAIDATKNAEGQSRYLLAKVNLARRLYVAQQNRELFRTTLMEVLRTDPAIWPEQRLANEVAHRRAYRYLKLEKEWF